MPSVSVPFSVSSDLSIPSPFNVDQLLELAKVAIERGLKPDEFRDYLTVIRTELPTGPDGDYSSTSRRAEFSLKNSILAVGSYRVSLPPKVAAMIKTLSKEPGTPMTIEELAAGINSPESSVYPTISSTREYLQGANLDSMSVILTIKGDKGSGERARYAWNESFPIELD